MLRGEKVGLRARIESDVPVLQEELFGDVRAYARSSHRPWQPVSPGTAAAPYAVVEPEPSSAVFSIVSLVDGALVGEGGLWGIDLHNRSAEVGIALLPGARGSGFAVDAVRVLCAYGFAMRGLHRLQIETLADNAAMRATAARAGFTEEGIRRASAWVDGTFADGVVLSLLADDVRWQ
uniref:GNAT family N-acetyltransferase n=1 Tax=Paractinoplanes polyasparticus TaxID=2856853 RepID=UPI001C859D22|nr:GNAT family protein [Actinoplanes polyasparticus]